VTGCIARQPWQIVDLGVGTRLEVGELRRVGAPLRFSQWRRAFGNGFGLFDALTGLVF